MKAKQIKYTQKQLKEMFYYDMCTGDLIWKINPCIANVKGKIAGYIRKYDYHKEYRIISINNEEFKAHRIIWIYLYGNLSNKLWIDHIDGNGLNNKIDILRLIDPKDNSKNLKRVCTNKSGCNGVSWNKSHRKWRARISDKNKEIFIGYFTEKEDAVEARKKAELKYGYFKEHGEIKNVS